MRKYSILLLALAAASTPSQFAERGPQAPPANAIKATVVRATNLYVTPAKTATRVTQVTPGREMVVVERNGPWVRVFANTDVETVSDEDKPVFGAEAVAPPISGWMEAAGVVDAKTPNGDVILYGVAVTDEVQASLPNAPQNVVQAARLLYKRVSDLFPNSPLAPEADWRTADIRWQLLRADVFSLPSAHEKDSYLREQIDDSEMRKLEKKYPHSKWSDLAAWDMLDNKICGDWQGSAECPKKESEIYQKYASEHPDSPKAPQALYEAVYREAVLNDMYQSDGDNGKADNAKSKASELANDLAAHYSQSDYAARAAGLIYQLKASIPIYGSDRD